MADNTDNKLVLLPKNFILQNAHSLKVRQDLKDLGYTWSNGADLTNTLLYEDVLIYSQNANGFNTLPTVAKAIEMYPTFPIIILKTGIIGFDYQAVQNSQYSLHKRHTSTRKQFLC